MTGAPGDAGPVTKDFRSAQALSGILAVVSVLLWFLLALVVKNDVVDAGDIRTFVPGPGALVTAWLAVTTTVFSAAAYAVSWVAVVVHKATAAVRQSVADAAAHH